MGGAVPPLPQYAFVAWCSVRGSTGTIVSTNARTLFQSYIIKVYQEISAGSMDI
jgi:hypothetical protein